MSKSPAIPHNEDPNGILKSISCFALDMDGTIYLGEKWIDGALGFLEAVKKSGRKYIFMTNNSSKSAADYIKKLDRMGLQVLPDEIITSGQATIAYLKENHAGKRVFLLGNESLSREFLNAGISLDDKSPELVVTAYDTDLTYEKLCLTCNFLRSGLYFVATHPDINCPSEGGFLPDIGAIHALLETSTGKKPDKIIGKPGREIIAEMLKQTGCSPKETAVSGDRLYTDVASGVNNGLTGILVLSGETKPEHIAASKVLPDLIFDSLKEMTAFL